MVWGAGVGLVGNTSTGSTGQLGRVGEGPPRPCASAYMGFLKAMSWQRGSAGSITRGGESICEGLRGERGR